MLQSCLDASGTRASHGETLWTAVNTQGFIFHNMSRQWRAQPTFMWGLQFASHRSPNTKYSIILSIPSHNCNSFFVKRHGAISGCGHALYSFRPLLHNSSKCRDKFPFCLLHCFLCGATQGRHDRLACFEMAVRSWKKKHKLHFYTFLNICALSLHLQKVKDLWKLENGTLCYVVATLASRLITTKHEGPVAHPLLATVKNSFYLFSLKMSPSVTTAL